MAKKNASAKVSAKEETKVIVIKANGEKWSAFIAPENIGQTFRFEYDNFTFKLTDYQKSQHTKLGKWKEINNNRTAIEYEHNGKTYIVNTADFRKAHCPEYTTKPHEQKEKTTFATLFEQLKKKTPTFEEVVNALVYFQQLESEMRETRKRQKAERLKALKAELEQLESED